MPVPARDYCVNFDTISNLSGYFDSDTIDDPIRFPYICAMLLAIDIGNTDTVVGIFDGPRLITHFRVSSTPNLTTDEAGLFVTSLFNHHLDTRTRNVSRVAVCSVVPTLTEVYERMTRKYFEVEPLTIGAGIKLPINIDYPNPAEIGADRLANAAAGFDRLKSAVIVVDLGTAITFDVISKSGTYLGGIIAPGTQTAGANLARKAARLFEVRSEKPPQVIGKSTAMALKSGLFYGTIGVIDHILERIFVEMGEKPPVIATGGEAMTYGKDSKYIGEIILTLTLEGIRLISDLNLAENT